MAVDIGEAIGLKGKKGFSDLGELISALLPNVYVIAGIICLFLLIFGGIAFILQAGRGETDEASNAKKAIGAAVLGFLVIFASYWIIQIIEYLLGIKILKPNV